MTVQFLNLQILRLIQKMKDEFTKRKQAKEQAAQNSELADKDARRRNFFQKKRLVNYEVPPDVSDSDHEQDQQNNNQVNASVQQNIFEQDPFIKNRAPSHSP